MANEENRMLEIFTGIEAGSFRDEERYQCSETGRWHFEAGC